MADFYCDECDVFFSNKVLLDQHDCDEEDGGSSTSYCCGQIYEEGETTCMSCGEPL